MRSFLEDISSQLLQTFGHDLSKVAVVFPNKRASLFLSEYLAREAGEPVWAPSYITISDLFRSLARRQVADPIKLVCDLHKSFTACTGTEETLDHFYGWGELLLADFDDVDKNMAPADKVFANLRDLHELDDDSYLTPQQRDIIRKFFSNFGDGHNSELKERFLRLWSHIGDIYHDFNRRLCSQGLAYEGALYREVAESETFDLDSDYYVFIGFNLLHPVEQALIRRLEQQGKARLIQDSGEDCPKQLTFISAPTENIQARYVSTWLDAARVADGRKTAIVLADERLLQSVVHCLPDNVQKVNITTGYPLSQTPIASDILQQVTRLANSHSDGQIPDIIRQLSDYVTQQAQTPESQTETLYAEALFRMYTLLNRLRDLSASGDLDIALPTLARLVTQIVNTTTIPYHGEPIEGIQVMGVLETRNLDFEHILLLSCNEGNLPKGVNDTSFIPYSIRKAYGLTTIDHKVAIYENYFNRLLQRAKDVTIVYNNSTNDGKTGEMSRFMLQLIVEGRHPIAFRTLQAGQQPMLHHPQPIPKSTEAMAQLSQLKHLTPTAIARYLRCPLQFFYRYITNLEQLEEEEETIDNRLFGNIFHKAAQNIYEKMKQRSDTITKDDIEQQLKTKVDIERAVDNAIKLEFFHIEDPMAQMPPLNGLQLINREVIVRYVCQLLEVDARLAPFTILGLEKWVDIPLTVGSLQLKLGGIVDRIDCITDADNQQRIRIIDYKTGSSRIRPLPDVEAIFKPESLKNHSDYFLQAFLYAHIYRTKSTAAVSPCLLFIQHASSENFDPTLIIGQTPVADIAEVSTEFMDRLQALIDEIFNPALPFLPTDDHNRCKSCPYRHLCG